MRLSPVRVISFFESLVRCEEALLIISGTTIGCDVSETFSTTAHVTRSGGHRVCKYEARLRFLFPYCVSGLTSPSRQTIWNRSPSLGNKLRCTCHEQRERLFHLSGWCTISLPCVCLSFGFYATEFYISGWDTHVIANQHNISSFRYNFVSFLYSCDLTRFN